MCLGRHESEVTHAQGQTLLGRVQGEAGARGVVRRQNRRRDHRRARAAQQGGQTQVERHRRLPQRRLGGQARGRAVHGRERPMGRDVQGLLLDRRGGTRGEAGGARRDSKGAGEAHVSGLAGGEGGCEFAQQFGLDLRFTRHSSKVCRDMQGAVSTRALSLHKL